MAILAKDDVIMALNLGATIMLTKADPRRPSDRDHYCMQLEGGTVRSTCFLALLADEIIEAVNDGLFKDAPSQTYRLA
ncbi:MAG: hypothetical protein COB08_019445 [Rhodobacteraceae bacterium]|nr:hypothetical protein [Paracoccaceae bacterium]